MEKNLTVPNVITGLRLLALPVMLYCIFAGHYHAFKWLLLGALWSDILDGFLARTLKQQTKLGSRMDAMADTLLYFVTAIALAAFQRQFLAEHWPEIALFFAVFGAEKVKTFLKFGKFFNSFHNYLAKVMGYVHGTFILTLFFFGFQGIIFYPAIVIGILSALEDMAVSTLVDTYENDTRGLFWVLKNKGYIR